MFAIRKGQDRGHANHGWLDTYHTFSFADYHDPQHVQFRSLRVMNEDRIAPGQGFGMHPHRDMEIVTYVLDGELQHRDSLGNGSVLRAGELQRMTAGTGIWHSEFNPSPTHPVHLYQIWLTPAERGLKPGYEQHRFETVPGGWKLMASPDGRDGSARIHQEARVSLGKADASSSLTYSLGRGRHAWLQVLRGDVTMNGSNLSAGDGVAISEEETLQIKSENSADVLLFDLA